jgi:transcription initiation factor TFIIIB Brf1 subunit/transcription initiation factor TFIIB
MLCPNCQGKKFVHEMFESYCLSCGLVLSSNIAYVGGFKIDYPWGLKL